MTTQEWMLAAAGAALALVVLAGLADARRARRRALDATGWVPWRGLQVAGFFAVLLFAILAWKASGAPSGKPLLRRPALTAVILARGDLDREGYAAPRLILFPPLLRGAAPPWVRIRLLNCFAPPRQISRCSSDCAGGSAADAPAADKAAVETMRMRVCRPYPPPRYCREGEAPPPRSQCQRKASR